jgi:nucleoside-diphosphate kinase
MNTNIEKTLIFLKPDVFEKKIIGKVISDIEGEGKFTILGIKMVNMTEEEAQKFYSVYKGKPFYEGLVSYVTRGPIVVMLIGGENVISEMRKFMGDTDPRKAEDNTLRGKYGEDLDNNVLHGSDSGESFQKEVKFFFEDVVL